MVATAAAVLLPNQWNWLPHPDARYSTAHSASNAAAHTPTNSAKDAAASDSTASTSRSSRPLQLRSGGSRHLGGRQEVLVLQGAPRRLPSADRSSADAAGDAAHARRASSTCRPIQLR